MITADTITDEQIRELERDARRQLRNANKAIAAAVAAQFRHRGQRKARAKCAELMNASSGVAGRLVRLTAERDEWKRRAMAHGCDAENGDVDCG